MRGGLTCVNYYLVGCSGYSTHLECQAIAIRGIQSVVDGVDVQYYRGRLYAVVITAERGGYR